MPVWVTLGNELAGSRGQRAIVNFINENKSIGKRMSLLGTRGNWNETLALWSENLKVASVRMKRKCISTTSSWMRIPDKPIPACRKGIASDQYVIPTARVVGACNQRGIERLVSNNCVGIGCDKIFAWSAPLVLSRHAFQLVHFMRRQLIASH